MNKFKTGATLLGVILGGYHALGLGQRSLVDRCIANGVHDETFLLLPQMCKSCGDTLDEEICAQ